MDPIQDQSGIQRAEPDVPDERRALVGKLCKSVLTALETHRRAFERMREDMRFTRRQLPGEEPDDQRAKVNIVQRHVAQKLATLYAKDPTFVAERRKRREFQVWDGKRSSLERAAAELQAFQQSGGATPMSVETEALLKDVQEGMTRAMMLENVGKSLEIALQYSLDEQMPPFKPQAKQMVRRTITCGVGYLELDFQRQLQKRPDTEARLQDITDRLAQVERLTADLADGEVDPHSAEAEQLRLAQAQIQAEVAAGGVVVREGLVVDFPAATSIIPLGKCRLLAPGFPGAWGLAKELLMTPEEVKETFSVDIGRSYTGYLKSRDGAPAKGHGDDTYARVWRIDSRKDGLRYWVCDGYPDFLKEPEAPPFSYLEPFFNVFPLVFNQVEDEEELFPESDVRLIRPIQREINRKREGVRQHRIASRPLYLTRQGALAEEEDQKSLANHAAHDVIEIQGLETNEDVKNAFTPFPKVGVDPNLYETGTDLTDLQLVVGAQEANLGGTGGDSATETSIAETSRLQSAESNIDDLDDFLSAFARAAGQVLLHELGRETATKIVGPGCVWPELSAQDLVEEVYLKVQAGSSGRPNKDRDLAALERVVPFLLQIPGVDPEWLAKHLITATDSRINIEEAVTYGLPSITNMNRPTPAGPGAGGAPGTGDPSTDPNQQGAEGGDNAPNDDTSRGGPQAANPAPDSVQPNQQAVPA